MPDRSSSAPDTDRFTDYPFDQTCCGQPMANSGAFPQAKATEELFVRNFAGYEHIVAPSQNRPMDERGRPEGLPPTTLTDTVPARPGGPDLAWPYSS